MATRDITISLRLPPPILRQLRDRHAETYADHRLSFNRWILSRIQLSFTTGV